ncbi:uncharacterized protein LOC125053659 isoform X1 [Pieris napi]|uniref:uncharacterized protein LOC125053659 isoform X1 n=1 Tax=Pieris napi TaxID=78633 RepID=UPI001FB925E8|nr:uncharacterized protein LOC125053659 isoform X1 [Pieris napi]
MDIEASKGKPLSKDETKALLAFIAKSKIINNKTTNATNNKLKIEEWKCITEKFNATVAITRRTPQQLRLKWENLKKNSRKRSTKIRMNHIKTGGGAPDYIPPDEILDHVSSLLGSTVNGFTVEFGGDAEPAEFWGDAESAEVISDTALHELNKVVGIEGCPVEVPAFSIDSHSTMSIPNDVVMEPIVVVDNGGASTLAHTPNKSKRFTFNSPRASGKQNKKPDEGRTEKNLAVAKYYSTKQKILDAKLNNILLQNKKLELEIKKLES